jgi:alkaline phosphatase D
MAAWRALEDVPVDFVLHLGDNVYAGSTDPAVLRRMYYWHRRLRPHRRVMAVTPMLAIWDDWDYAGGTAYGDGDGTAIWKQQSLRTFKELWANPSYGQPSDPGIYFKFSRGDVDFFMLDVRYHRSPNGSEDIGQKTMLGPAQLTWLKRELAGSDATLKFLVSGSQWTGSGTSDSWRSFTRERNGLFDFIRDNGIDGVVLLSGDRHLTAGYQVQQRFVEITSSPFAAENHRPPYPPKEMFMLHDQGNFFVVLDMDTRSEPPRLVVEVHRVGKGMVRRRPLKWEEINGKVRIPTCELFIDCRN